MSLSAGFAKLLPRRWQRVLFVAALVSAAVAAVMFGIRTYHSYQVLRSAREVGAGDLGNIRGWMTLRYVARVYHVPEPALVQQLGLPPDTDPHTSLRQLARARQRPVTDEIRDVQAAIADLRRAAPAPPPPPGPPPPGQPPAPGGGGGP